MSVRIAFHPRPAEITLEEIIDRVAALGRLPALNLTKSDRGYQCSVQRHNMTTWGVFHEPTASAALIAALSPYAFQSWDEHLALSQDPAPVEDDDFSHLI